MNRIKNFGNFDDLSFISESRVYFMSDFIYKLYDLSNNGNHWASELINAQTKNIDSDTTFLTLDGENFSFSKESDLKKVLDPVDYKGLFIDEIDKDQPQRIGHYIGSNGQNYISSLSNRGRVKMGRVIKKILPNIPDKDLEILVNDLKSETTGYEIKLVNGIDIEKYYKTESCDPKLIRYGSLQSSCMMDKASEKPNIFDIYTKNPDVCQLAVMLNKDGQLVGRALIWKIHEIIKYNDQDIFSDLNIKWNNHEDSKSHSIGNPNNLFIMDRVYYTRDWMENAFYKWASENGFAIKSRDGVIYKGKMINYNQPILNIKVNKLGYRQFPYLDTFKYYDVQSSMLSNQYKSRGFELNSVSGQYQSRGTRSQKTVDKATNYIRRFKDFFN